MQLLTKSYRRLTIQLLISKKEQAPLKTRLQTVIRKFQTRFADVDVQTVLNNCLSDSQHNLTGLVDVSIPECAVNALFLAWSLTMCSFNCMGKVWNILIMSYISLFRLLDPEKSSQPAGWMAALSSSM